MHMIQYSGVRFSIGFIEFMLLWIYIQVLRIILQ